MSEIVPALGFPGRSSTSILGNSVLRREDETLVRGLGRFVANETFDDLLHAHFVRSTVAHGQILSVDVEEARSMPGVLGVYVSADIGLADNYSNENYPPGSARPFLAYDRVRFVGEPFAVVVAEDQYIAADAAESVWADIETLEAVVTLDDSLKGETILYPGSKDNLITRIDSEKRIDFSSCEHVVVGEFWNSRIATVSIEPRVIVASFEKEKLTCWASNQGAHAFRNEVARCLNMERNNVRVLVGDVGGGFGAKAATSEEEVVVAQLARLLGRPIRWIESRTENLSSFTHGRAQSQKVTIGGSKTGKITHYRLEVLQDSGAYPKYGAGLPELTKRMASGVYAIENIEFSSMSVATNTASVCAFRGAGRPEATAAIERAVDLFASEIAMDPAEVRRINMLPPEAFPYVTPTGANMDSGDYEVCLDRALGVAGYSDLRAEQKRKREIGDSLQIGIGVSSYVEITGFGGSEYGEVRLQHDGTILATTGSTPIGTGHHTTWAMLVADRLSVPLESIKVLHGDTDAVPSGETTGGSRSVQIAGSAIANASEKLVELAKESAANLFEAAVEDIVFDQERGEFHVVGTPATTRTWKDIAASLDVELVGLSDYSQDGATFPFGTHIAVVEVDIETGLVAIKRLIAVDDAGKIVNPLLAAGQIHGGLAQGVAQGLLEEIRYDSNGNPQTTNLMDYSVISTMEVPSFERSFMETLTPRNPLGAKGIGESGTIGSTVAVQNAVIDALTPYGIRHIDMPMGPEKIWKAINEAV